METRQISKAPYSHQYGLSFIELLLVVALITTLGAVGAPIYGKFIVTSQFDSTHTLLLSTIEKARQYAMAGKNDSDWGICLVDPQTIRMYQGNCDAPPFSEDTPIPAVLTVSGLTNIAFAKRTGEPSTTANITIESAYNSAAISINAAGAAEY